ncbi:uncharacterized protein LOC136079138 [Hydra vulgaris]|uniref:Uncharacterized protein LOC136079138 n=1 Tax=Hydra vulgaris TaxID=6087 RepID=A0ABM4BP86_HYDVU
MVRQTDSKIESLVLRLRKEEKWSIGQITAHVKMSKGEIHKIIHREKSKNIVKKGGRPRITDKRTDRKIVRKSLENPHLTAPEIRLQTGMENVSTRTIQAFKRRRSLWAQTCKETIP